MVSYQVKINGTAVDFVSIEYSESLDPEPQPFRLVLGGTYSLAEHSTIEVYRNGVLEYTGLSEGVQKSYSEEGETTEITGRDISLKALVKVIGPDEFMGGEPANLIKAINLPNVPLTKKDPNTKQLLWSASSNKNSADAWKAVDGDPYVGWNAGGTQALNDWFQVDMAGTKTNVCRVTIEHEADKYAENYSIQLSPDGSNWTTVASKTGNQIKNIDETFTPMNARYVKINITANGSRPWAINEIWVYTKTEDQIFTLGTLEPYGYGVYGQLGNFENRLAKMKRIADYIGWDVWVTPDGKLNFKPSRGEDKSSTVILESGKNCKVVENLIDYSSRFDKITLLGAGQGDAQISYTVSVDPLPSNPKEGIFIESDITDLETLMKRAQVLLNEYKEPKKSVKIEVVGPLFEAHAGDTVRVKDTHTGLDENIRVYKVERRFSTSGEEVTVELGEPREDLALRQAEIASAIKSLEQYFGGIPTSFQYGWADNVGPGYPIEARIKIPYECREVSYVKMDIFGEKYRTYSTGAASGGGTTVTSSAVLPSHTHSVTLPSHQHDVAIGTRTAETTSLTGSFYTVDSFEYVEVAGSAHSHGYGYTDYANPDTPHRHGISSTVTSTYGFLAVTGCTSKILPTAYHTHPVNIGTVTSQGGGGTTVTSASGGASHSHDVSLPSHTHSLVYGIYEGGYPSNVVLEVINPDGGTISYGTVASGGVAFSIIDKDVSRGFTKPGVYSIRISTSSLGRIRFNIYGQMLLGARIP